MCPWASSHGMRTSGGMLAPEESHHRSRASKPSRRPLARSTAGWNANVGVPSRPRREIGEVETTSGGELVRSVTFVTSASRATALSWNLDGRRAGPHAYRRHHLDTWTSSRSETVSYTHLTLPTKRIV